MIAERFPARLLLVGAGRMGRYHAQALLRSGKAHPAVPYELVGIVDSHRQRADRLAAETGTRAYYDIDDCQEKIDAAILAVPTRQHLSVGIKLLEAGADLLIEKPLAPSVAAAETLIHTAARNNRVLSVGQIEWFNPALRSIHSRIHAPSCIDAVRAGGLRRETADVNVIWDLMIHDLDIALQLVGAYPTSVSAIGAAVATQDIDITQVELDFPGGCQATLIASRVSLTQVRRMQITASGAEWLIDYLARSAYQRHADTADHAPLKVRPADPLHSEQEAFFSALETREAGPVDARRSLPALRLAEQISESITRVPPSELPRTLLPYVSLGAGEASHVFAAADDPIIHP